MKVVLACTLLIALTSGRVFAQDDSPHINLLEDGPGKTAEQIEHDKAVERAYKDSLRKIPDAATSNDPWGSVRSDGAPKVTSKSKPKTGNSQARNLSAKSKAKSADN